MYSNPGYLVTYYPGDVLIIAKDFRSNNSEEEEEIDSFFEDLKKILDVITKESSIYKYPINTGETWVFSLFLQLKEKDLFKHIPNSCNAKSFTDLEEIIETVVSFLDYEKNPPSFCPPSSEKIKKD